MLLLERGRSTGDAMLANRGKCGVCHLPPLPGGQQMSLKRFFIRQLC